MNIRVPAQRPKSGHAKIAFVAEAPGEMEEMHGAPLIGPAGRLFNKVLVDAGITRDECLVTNVLDFKLEKNAIDSIAVSRTAVDGYDMFPDWAGRAVASGKYLPGDIAEQALGRLRAELLDSGANIVVALGGLSIWALLQLPGHGTVTKMRGNLYSGVLTPQKVIPTYHPAYVLRSFQHYPVLWADIKKSKRESEFPEIRPATFPPFEPVTSISYLPTMFSRLRAPVACDIETARGQIDCIGFSDGELTFTVPFFCHKTFASYWSAEDEARVRRIVCDWLASPVDKIFQNGTYDIQMLWEYWRAPVLGYTHDTRILHRSLWPELKADLGSMVSLHTDLPAWKPLKQKSPKRNG